MELIMSKRYQPEKKTNPVEAIGEFCIECMGGRDSGQPFTKLITECPSPECALYEFRLGKNPYHKQNLSNQQRKILSDRAKNSPLIQRAARKTHSNLDDLNRGKG